MWRRSSHNLASHPNLHPSSLFLLLRTAVTRSTSSAASPESAALAANSVRKDFGISTTSASALDLSSLAAASVIKAKDVVDFGKYYGSCYWELSKARLSMLVVATSGTGFVLGSGNSIDYMGLCCTCAGTMMVAAAANSLNQVFEVKNDALMKRTRLRPLPSGRMSIPHAVAFASSVGVAGTALLACKANALAAGLAASNLILYSFIYTPLKQIHPVNTWVGAIVGAIPPLLGWAAASGQVSMNAMILPAALYFWQLPHFMALAYLCRKDYADGGFKMFSLFDPSGRRTALVALRNCLYLLPLGYLAYDWGVTSLWFCLESTLLALAISFTAVSFYLNRTTKSARTMFHASLLYLPVFMSGLLFHRVADSDQCLTIEDSRMFKEVSSSKENTMLQKNSDQCLTVEDSRMFKELSSSNDNPMLQKKATHKSTGNQVRPPVAYASIPPFPFLPAPSYQ